MEKIIDMLTVKAHAARTVTSDPLQKFKFRVTLPGYPSMGFQKCSGLSDEATSTEYDEGGFDFTHKLPGRRKVGDVTLERGAYSDISFQHLIQEALTDPNMRNTIVIEHLDRFGNVARTYKLAEAWVSKWEGSDLDASSDDVAIEKLTIIFEYFL